MRHPALPLLIAITMGSLASAQSPAAPRSGMVVVVDPGHGGDDAGVHTDSGLVEKDVVLQVAQRVVTALDAKAGLRALLTRDADRPTSLDDRAAIANRTSGVAFLSLHLNAAVSDGATGAVIYLLPAARTAPPRRGGNDGPPSLAVPVPGGGTKDLPLLPWTEVQRAHAEGAARLAALLAPRLEASTGAPSTTSRAPIRVLAGIDMPAVLIELGYLTSPEFASEVVTEPFQTKVAQSIADAVADFVAGVEPEIDTPR